MRGPRMGQRGTMAWLSSRMASQDWRDFIQTLDNSILLSVLLQNETSPHEIQKWWQSKRQGLTLLDISADLPHYRITVRLLARSFNPYSDQSFLSRTVLHSNHAAKHALEIFRIP